MAKKVYENSRLFVEGYRVGRFSRSVTVDIEAEEGDGKTFYSEGWNETTRGGRSIAISYEGYILTQDDPHRMEADLDNGELVGLTLVPDGDVYNADSLFVHGRNTGAGYEYSGDDTGALNVDMGGSSKPLVGKVLLIDTLLDTTGEYGEYDLGAAAPNGVTIVLHVLDIDGSVPEVEITLEDSSDDVSYASVEDITVETRGCYVIRVTGSVERYIRLAVDLGADTDSVSLHGAVYR